MERELAGLRAEIESLQAKLDDAQETLRAIREGAVDALLIDTPEGQRVFTLQGEEHPYRALIEQMREGAATLTPEGVVHYCNGRFAEMLHLPLERVMGGQIEDFVAPADRPRLAVMLSEGGGRADLALSAGAGAEMPTTVSAIKLRAVGPAAVCLVVSDLTERKRHEAAIHQLNGELEERVLQRTVQLLERNEKLREQAALLELAHDAIIVRDSEDNITFWNRGAEETYGWMREEVVTHFAQHVLKTRFPQALSEIKDALAKEDYWEGEVIQIRKDGREIVVASRWAAQRDKSGRQVGTLEINRDITERKRAEEETRHLHDIIAQDMDRLSGLVNSITDEIWFADASGKFTLTNPSASREFNLGEADKADAKQLIESLEVLRMDGTPRPIDEALRCVHFTVKSCGTWRK